MTDEGGGASLTTDPASGSSAATDISLREYAARDVWWLLKWLDERDRRYSEVAAEKEKALKIKETADLAALELAREIQTYKDEKANELRSQIERERGSYLARDEYNTAHRALIDKVDTGYQALFDKMENALKPLSEFVSRQQGGTEQRVQTRQGITFGQGLVASGLALILAIFAIYAATHSTSSGGNTPAVVCTATYHPAPCPQP